MAAYRDYLRILRLLNSKLRALALWRKVRGKVTSYTARHTWATAGKYCHIPIEIISEGLGHASVTTTEGYERLRKQPDGAGEQGYNELHI